MASTGTDVGHLPPPPAYGQEKETLGPDRVETGSLDSDVQKSGHVHRKLKSRHIQLIGIGGTIGTALYVQTASLGGYIC